MKVQIDDHDGTRNRVRQPGSSCDIDILKTMYRSAFLLAVLGLASTCSAFAPVNQQKNGGGRSDLKMAMDPVTYLRTEWVSASLVTNQTPRSADTVLQLGCIDGRAVTFVPRTVRELITSTVEPDGNLPVRVERQLKQSEERRKAAKVIYKNQRADDLKETEDNSVDIVISLQAVEAMKENGLDWKKSVREAARVLKPGGRFIWVEPTEIDGQNFVDYLGSLVDMTGIEGDGSTNIEASDEEDDEDEESNPNGPIPVFDDGGFDAVDFVLQPHIAGVAFKSIDAGLTPEQRAQKGKVEEEDKMAEISLQAYERGLKKRKKKKKGMAPSEETL